MVVVVVVFVVLLEELFELYVSLILLRSNSYVFKTGLTFVGKFSD